MDGRYVQKYNNDDKKLIKVLFLGVCILLDLIVLAGIVACFSTRKYLDLLIYAGVFIVAIAIRIASLFLTYQIIITVDDDEMSIIKKYPIKEKFIYQGKICNLNPKKYHKENVNLSKKNIRLCPKSCEDSAYMVELFGRKYLIYFDDYTYSLIEVNSDLS